MRKQFCIETQIIGTSGFAGRKKTLLPDMQRWFKAYNKRPSVPDVNLEDAAIIISWTDLQSPCWNLVIQL